MPPTDKAIRPIIVIKKKVSHGGHHGGAWKVAYADFVTAMMSLFIVLWLLNSTPQVKKAISGYFKDPRGSGKEMGLKTPTPGEGLSVDKMNVAMLKEKIEKAILQQTDLNKLSKQVEITVTGEGLKIELFEDKGGTFFESGSAKLSESGVKLLDMLAGQLKVLPNDLLIEGHTDAQPFAGGTGYSNWELSSDRANSARRLLQLDGVGPQQISQVRGYADQSLRVPASPLDASNRRISLIVQWEVPPASAQEAKAPAPPDETKQKANESATAPIGHAAESPSAESASSAKPLPTQPAPTAPKPTLMARMKLLLPGKKK
jgi:chemotaxis protein MotB